MDLDNELECCIAVYLFLIDESEPVMTKGLTSIESLDNMIMTLSKYGTDMIPFTNYLNKKYNSSEVLWQDRAIEFFATTKAISFYKKIIRDLKIKLCLKDQK